MEALDIRGKLINIGSFVRYSETGTIGNVSEITDNLSLNNSYGTKNSNHENYGDNNHYNDEYWIKIDKTGLWYLSSILEVISKYDAKHSRFDNLKKETIKNELKDTKDDFENMQMSSSVGEGGG
jgi:hypothetical protein